MAKGDNYFIWVDPDTPWSDDLLVYSENVFSFSLSQDEGKFAQLNVTLFNPKTGVLNTGAGRKLWAWFAHECDDNGSLLKMYGRLFGIPTSLVGELATFLFRARPVGYEDIRREIGETLKVRPYYTRTFVDPQREQDDLDIVLEAYAATWHIDREDHEVTISSLVTGEDGLIILTKHLYDGLEMGIPTGPIAKVTVPVRFNWTQKATGLGWDLGKYITDNWPHEEGVGAIPGVISSFTFGENSVPKAGTSIGTGWQVTYSQTTQFNDLTVRHYSNTFTFSTAPATNFLSQESTVNWPSNETSSSTTSESFDYIGGFPSYENSPPGAILYNSIVTQDETKVEYSDWEGFGESQSGSFGSKTVISLNRQYAEGRDIVPKLYTAVQLFVGFAADRPVTESVRVTMLADIQAVHTDPEDDMELLLPDLQSVDLAKTIQGEYTILPIGNAGYRSYLQLEQGKDDLKYVLALMRAHLLVRSRCVEIKMAPFSNVMPLITLRKSVQVFDDRIPGGVAVGKVTSYSLSLDGNSGALERSITIQCCVGRAGGPAAGAGGVTGSGDTPPPPAEHTFELGEPIYATRDYMPDEYQEILGAEVAVDPADTGTEGYIIGPDTGFEIPLIQPNDEGINILSPDLTVEDLIEEPLVVLFPPATQRLHLSSGSYSGTVLVGGDPALGHQALAERAAALQNTLDQIRTEVRFKLRDMTKGFITEYFVDTKDLLVPKQIDLGG